MKIINSDKQISIYNLVSVYSNLPIKIIDKYCLKYSLFSKTEYKLLFRAKRLNEENFSNFIINEALDNESIKVLILDNNFKLTKEKSNFIKQIFKTFGKKYFIFNLKHKIKETSYNLKLNKIFLEIINNIKKI